LHTELSVHRAVTELVYDFSKRRCPPNRSLTKSVPRQKGAPVAQGTSIKVISYALDELLNGEIVLRGVVDPSSLSELKVAGYQREVLASKKVGKLMEAIAGAGVPDIVLGMRGQQYIERNGALYLHDPVFIIDGLQRKSAAERLMLLSPEVLMNKYSLAWPAQPHLGATIHFSTTDTSEREMFERVNVGQTRLSGNVHLRNLAVTNPAVDALFKLTNDKSFALYNVVSWDQAMNRSNLVTATTYVKVAAMLHSHAGPGRNSQVHEVAGGLMRIMDNVGKPAMVANVTEFFRILDQCFHFKRVSFNGSATFVKTNFLIQLAKILSDHSNFWQDNRLVVDTAFVKKLASFPMDDPEVMRLASAGGQGAEVLYLLMVKHIDSGKRTNRLKARRGYHDRYSPISQEEGAED
jgi:hypothetical protein